MRIIVLLKQPENGKNGFYQSGFMTDQNREGQRIGYDDGNALEMALRIKDRDPGESVEIIALSAGSWEDETVLREALALGADKAFLISDPGMGEADSAMTALCLAAAVRKIGAFDLILAGYKSQDEKAGSVGPMTAEFLDISQISHVERFKIEDGRAEAVADQGDCGLRMNVELPCCLIINKMKFSLRIMTLHGVRKAVNKIITIWSFKDLDWRGHLPSSKSCLIYKFQNCINRKGRIISCCFDSPKTEHVPEPKSKPDPKHQKEQLTGLIYDIKSEYRLLT